MRAKPPKYFRLSDDWLRCVMKAFLLLSPGTSWERAILRRILRWSTDDVHETTDVERTECSADLLEVKGAKMRSKSSPWITGRDALELLTTAETATSRRAAGTGLYLRSDRSDQQSTTREFAKDVQELGASLVWASGDWNGDALMCESTSAATVRHRSPTIETNCANRREAQENHTDDVIAETHGDAADDITESTKGTDVRKYQADAEEVDAADVSDKEFEGLKKRGEQLLEVRNALEVPMEDVETIRERELARGSALEAGPAAANSASRGRECPAWVSREQNASQVGENLNNLDTKALGREVISSNASGCVTIPAIALGGVLAAILVRTINANRGEFKDGCRLKRVKDTKTRVASTADSISKFMRKCWSRRSSRENNAGLACGHEQVKSSESADAAQRRRTVECPKQKIEKSMRPGRLRVLNPHRLEKQRTFHNKTQSTRPSPQVTDQGLLGK